jgi:hypothetical protein
MDEVVERPYFQRRLREEIARSRRFNRPFVLVLLEASPGGGIKTSEKVSAGLRVLHASLREYDFAFKVFEDTLAAALLETDLAGAKAALHRLSGRLSARAGSWRVFVYPFPECADQIQTLPAVVAV